MDPRYRSAFNRAYTDGFYADFLRAFEQKVGAPIPYRVAETPFFIPAQLRDRLAQHARETRLAGADDTLDDDVAILAHGWSLSSRGGCPA